MFEDEPLQIANTKGWDNEFTTGAFYQVLLPANPNDLITSNEFERGFAAAMMPSPSEVAKYNIPSDITPDINQCSPLPAVPNIDCFSKLFDGAQNLAFWAPLSPADQANSDQVKGLITNLILQAMIPPPGADAGSFNQIRDAMISAMVNYVETKLRAQQGENGEGFNIAKLTNPFPQPNAFGNKAVSLPQDLTTTPQKVRTSWNTTKDGRGGTPGRVGYSVKVISFSQLMSSASNGPVGADAGDDADFALLQH
jgi:hypothetical protein